MAIKSLTEGLLRKGHDLRLLMIETYKHPFDPEAFPTELLKESQARSVFVETKLDPVDAFTSLVNRDPYNVNRFFSPDLDHVLVEMLKEEEPDIVQLESLFMTPYIDTVRKFSNARVVFRSHNLEHRIWQKIAQGTNNPLKKAYLKLLSEQLWKYEKKILFDVDGLVSISDEDLVNFQKMGIQVPTITIPFGIDTKVWSPDHMEEGNVPRFFHMGSMDWMPNQEAVDQLLEEVWPKVREKMPAAELCLIGKNMDREQGDVPAGVRVIGEVDDPIEAIRDHGIMLVPLRSGSGIRVRIIQGMALEKPIVSTSIGASGIRAKDGRELLIADGPDAFAKKMIELAERGELRKQLGKTARQTVLDHYDEELLIDRLLAFYQELVETVP
ncbi:MAG: glycosyltransferase family 4 protein [Flavobacteriales bacterium]